MNEEIQIFKNEEFGEVRTLVIGNEPWFVGKDVAEILGYDNQNRDVIRHVDEEDRIMVNKTQYQNGIELDYKILGQRGGWIINESGLYSLILSSQLPNAKKFKKWVTSEVLPSIRKHGAYMTENTLEEAIRNPDFLIKLATELKKEQEKRKNLEEENAQKAQIIGELKPKADYTDLILKSKSVVTITQIAKDYGMSGKEMNAKLHELKVQYLVGSQWVLYAKYQAKGYTSSETVPITHSDGSPGTKMNTKWTQKGRLFIYNLLKTNGILPVIEKM